MFPRLMTLTTIALLVSPAIAHAGDAAFDKAVDAYYAEYPAAHPTGATELGIHTHDAKLEDLSAAGIAREVKRLKRWKGKLAALYPGDFSPSRRADMALLQASIDASLLDLEEVQGWRHRPDVYPGLASRTVYVIIKRDFAPAAERLESVLARQAKIPALLAEGKRNLRDVAPVAVDIALSQIPGIVEFFERDVPLAFPTIKDLSKLKASSARVAAALNDYAAFLKAEVQPKAKAPFAIGEEKFRKKLRLEEMIDAPLDELLARGEAELKRLQAEFRATAQKIDPRRPFLEVQTEVQKDHDTPDKLIAGTQARLAGLKKFLLDRQIVSVPSEVMPKVEETPPFLRATTFASMETPGPFETRATEAYYNVTLPEASWTPAQVEDFLRGAFSRTLVDVVSIHEAFPGHYVQFLWLPKVKSKVRKYEGASSNSEGWAHYCEQMMLDEGYGDGDPKLRLAQLQDALLRAARFIVGIKLHTRGMTLDDAITFFQKEGYQSKKVAEMETRRGTADPTYLYYTLGKLEVYRLRADYQRKLGPAYSLKKFHDAFLAEGAAPIPLVREALLK
jgi:uncharacterized protein (DUF885 family)